MMCRHTTHTHNTHTHTRAHTHKVNAGDECKRVCVFPSETAIHTAFRGLTGTRDGSIHHPLFTWQLGDIRLIHESREDEGETSREVRRILPAKS